MVMRAFLCWVASSSVVGKAGGLVEEEEVGGIDLTMGNQIIRHFLVKFGPFNVGFLDDTVDLGQRKSILLAQSFGLGTLHLSK